MRIRWKRKRYIYRETFECLACCQGSNSGLRLAIFRSGRSDLSLFVRGILINSPMNSLRLTLPNMSLRGSRRRIKKRFCSRTLSLIIDMKSDGLLKTEPAHDDVSPTMPLMMLMSSHDKPNGLKTVASKNGWPVTWNSKKTNVSIVIFPEANKYP